MQKRMKYIFLQEDRNHEKACTKLRTFSLVYPRGNGMICLLYSFYICTSV